MEKMLQPLGPWLRSARECRIHCPAYGFNNHIAIKSGSEYVVCHMMPDGTFEPSSRTVTVTNFPSTEGINRGGRQQFTFDSSERVDHTHGMSKRLQVLLDETEFLELQRMAEARRMTVAAWVRETPVLTEVERRQLLAENAQAFLGARFNPA